MAAERTVDAYVAAQARAPTSIQKWEHQQGSTVHDERARRVQAVVAAIPPGEVLSYGDVAARAGLRSARLVGRILAESHGLPWHRVLRADGTPTPHLAARQMALLGAEGVRFVNGRIVC